MIDWARGEILGPFILAGALTWVSVVWQRLWFLSLIASAIVIITFEAQ